MEGGVVTPVPITYNAGDNPNAAWWTTGSSIWIHAGSTNVLIEDIEINHTGGYAIYWRAVSHGINFIDIIRPRITNSRPAVRGFSEDYNYFGWNGGIFGSSDGSSAYFSDIRVLDAFFQNVTGHCFWTRADSLGDSAFINRNVTFIGNCEDHLGDGTEPGDIDTYWEEITSRRCGFICATSTTGFVPTGGGASTLVDSTPDGTRIPKWLASPQVPAVVADTTGLLLNATRQIRADGVNGQLCSADGMGNSTISAVGTSAFFSTDQLIVPSQCGVGGNGINVTKGIEVSNSNAVPGAGQYINITGCELNGFGYSSVGGYAMQYGSISGCIIRQPTVGPPPMPPFQSSPIVLGNITVGPVVLTAHSNKVSGCHIEWLASGGFAISEDASMGAFNTGDTNWVDSTNTTTAQFLLPRTRELTAPRAPFFLPAHRRPPTVS